MEVKPQTTTGRPLPVLCLKDINSINQMTNQQQDILLSSLFHYLNLLEAWDSMALLVTYIELALGDLDHHHHQIV